MKNTIRNTTPPIGRFIDPLTDFGFKRIFGSERIFQKLFHIAEVANLKKEEYMLYEKAILDKWTDYAVRKTAEEKMKTADERVKTAEEEIKTAKEKIKIAEKKIKIAEEKMKTAEGKGVEKGIEQKSYEVVENLIIKFGFSDDEVAKAAGIPIAIVEKIRAALKKKK